LTSIATVSLVRLPGALISGVGINSGTTIHVGQPGTFAALLTGPHYSLPGVHGRLLSQGDHLVAATHQSGLLDAIADPSGIYVANIAVPLQLADWTELSTGPAFEQPGRARVQLTDDELLVLAPQPIERAGMETINSMKLLRRPLDDLSVDWSREFVTEEPWIDPWAFPIPDGMILAWRPDAASDELRWHKHVGD
jgi:hypothetical protein